MAESEEKLIKAIKHYQESLDRHTNSGNTDKLLHGIEKLGRLSIKVCHLELTGVGRTVNGLKRFDGPVGESARNLVDKWKSIVKGEEEEEQRLQRKEKNKHEKSLMIAENSDSDSSSKKANKSKHTEKRRSRSRDRKSSNSYSKKKSSHKSSSDDSDSDSKKKKKSSRRTESSESSDSSSDKEKRYKSSSKDKKKNKKLKERHLSPEKKRKREESPEKQSKKHKKESSEKIKDRKNEKTSSSAKSNKSSSPTASTSKKNVSTEKLVNGIDSESGASFADVLNMLGTAPVVKSSKKRVSAPESVEKCISKPVREKESSRSSSKSYQEPRNMDNNEEEVPNLLKQNPSNLEPLDINLASLLPSITPNYRPLNAPLDGQNRKMWMDDEALCRVISAKHQRTKVYSGVKCGFTKVPSLFEICSRVLQDNLDALEYTGGVPYSILKPILEKANPDQLYQLEFHNPYLIEDSDELWQLHCQKEFRNKKREELESWRDMYMRCLDEREAKLKALTANIKQSQDKSVPVRQTKLAYVDSFVKPPRNIARKQAKNGTASAVMKKPSQTPSDRLSQLSKSSEAGKTVVPNPARAAIEKAGAYTPSNLKQKKAPLMAKALSVLKNRFGRR